MSNTQHSHGEHRDWVNSLPHGELVWSVLDKKLMRFDRVEGTDVFLLDRNTGELHPWTCGVSQVKPASFGVTLVG
jgi:hypothetical protein